MNENISIYSDCFKTFNIYDDDFKNLFINYVENYFVFIQNNIFINQYEIIFFKVKFYRIILSALNNIIENIETPPLIKIILKKYFDFFNIYLLKIKNYLDENILLKNFLEIHYFINNEHKISFYFEYIIYNMNKINEINKSNNTYKFLSLLQYEVIKLLNLQILS